MKEKNINYNIVFLRFVAIMVVMFGHAIIIYDPDWGYYLSQRSPNVLIQTKHIINIIQMPLFFSISGFLFYNLTKKHFKKFDFVKKKFKRLMIPYLFFGLFYLLPIKYLMGYERYISHSLKYNIFYNIIIGLDNGHLWYLLTLFIIFLFFMFYKDFNNKFVDLLLSLFLICVNVFSIRYKSYIQLVPFYLIFFYFGMLMNKYSLNKKLNLFYTILPVIVLLITNIIPFNTNLLLSFKVILQLIILFFLYNIDYTALGKNRIIYELSDKSFGMYLFHSPLLLFMYIYYPDINPLFMITISFFVLGFVSYILTILLSKSKLKFVLGQ